MEVKATVKLDAKELYAFLMHHIYSSTTGFIGILLSIGGFIGFFYMIQMEGANPLFVGALFMTGLMFTVVQPIMTYSKAKKQEKRNEEECPESLLYVITKQGINVTQGEKKGFSTWDEIVRIESTKNLIMLYTGKVHAYVIPKDEIGDQMDVLKALIRENCMAGYIKI